MADTKYGKYVMREPLHKGRGPTIHVCAEDGCIGAAFPGFPAEMTGICITEPLTMNPQPHAHDYDQFLCFFGGNPLNFFEFGAEVVMTLGEEEEKHLIDTSSIVYIPKGLIHCPVEIKKVDKPIIFFHICFAPTYTRSVGDMSGHPAHSDRVKYSPEEAAALRAGGLPGNDA